MDFNKYIDESYAIAEIAYDDITEGSDQEIPDAYKEKFTPIVKRRLALSGYRLAYMIEELFGTKSDKAFDIKDYMR